MLWTEGHLQVICKRLLYFKYLNEGRLTERTKSESDGFMFVQSGGNESTIL